MALTDTTIRTMRRQQKPFKMHVRDGLFLLANPAALTSGAGVIGFDGEGKLTALGE